MPRTIKFFCFVSLCPAVLVSCDDSQPEQINKPAIILTNYGNDTCYRKEAKSFRVSGNEIIFTDTEGDLYIVPVQTSSIIPILK